MYSGLCLYIQWVPCVSVFTFYALYSFLLQRVVDGGFSDNIPHAKDIDDVITVSPFPGDFDICPEEDHHHNMKHFFHVANMELQFNMHNWWRIKQCLISPSMSELRDIQREGYRDTLRFLKARGEWTTHMPFQTHTCIHVHTHHFRCTHHTHTHLYTHVP